MLVSVPSPAYGQEEGAELGVVLEETIQGDLLLAGNSNLLEAGGWGPAAVTAADVDGDRTNMCIGRRNNGGIACADNSSSATVDLPAPAAVIAARLYVNTSVSGALAPLRVRVSGPGDGVEYTELGLDSATTPKLFEVSTGTGAAAVQRQAVWDLTEFVASHGAGEYTVADIVNERSRPWLPYASWSLVVAYEFDVASDVAFAELAPEVQQRFARRAVSWHDGLAVASDAPVEVEVGGFEVRPGQQVFAKSFHVVTHPGPDALENVLFDGGPLGNNATPGDSVAPPGVVIGADAGCNSIVDILNDTVCMLGTAVAAKRPGPLEFRAAHDGATVSSGSAVDMDVVRIPDRYFLAGATTATLSVQPVGAGSAGVGMLAVSVDQPEFAPAVAP